MGFDDLRRFCDLQGGPLPIYGSLETLKTIERTFYYAFNPKRGRCPATCTSFPTR